MSDDVRAGLAGGRRVRADVRQALLKSSVAHLYPGIPPGEWQPAAVMVNQVLALRSRSAPATGSVRERVLDPEHFEFRGRLSAGALDDQRRSRMEDRLQQRSAVAE
jgi:hypothetical protein